MNRLKVAHSIKNRCMAVRLYEGLPQTVKESADVPAYLLQMTDYRGYTHRAMAIAERLLKCG